MRIKLLFVVKNVIRLLLLLVAVSIVAFALMSMSPVDPLQANVGQAALGSMSPEQIAKLELYWGPSGTPVERYLAWARDFARGDMGVSLAYRQDVAQVIGQRLASSLLLMAIAWVLSGAIGFALGVVAGANAGRPVDRLIKSYALLIASTPAFWLALVFLLLFSVRLRLLPIGLSVPIGLDAASVTIIDRLRHAILPAAVMSISGISGIALHTREKLIGVMQSEYMLFARARGETKWVAIWRHGLRNIMLPAITLQFASIAEVIGGSVLVEQVFSYPGLGQAAVSAGLGGDVPLLLGIAVVSAAIVFAGNFAANMLYGVIDPKIRRGLKA